MNNFTRNRKVNDNHEFTEQIEMRTFDSQNNSNIFPVVGTEIDPEDKELTPAEALWNRFKDIIFKCLSTLILATSYVTAETRRRSRAFFIGLSTIIIVVFFVSLLSNAVSKAPLVFLKLSEDNAGEIDMSLTPSFTQQNSSPFLNFTDIDQKLSPIDIVSAAAPRWILPVRLANKYRPQQSVSASLMIFDSELEHQLGIGRSWPYRPIGEGEMHLRDGLIRGLDVRPQRGERITLSFNVAQFLGVLRVNETSPLASLAQAVDGGPANVSDLIRIGFAISGTPLDESERVDVAAIADAVGVTVPPPLDGLLDVNVTIGTVLDTLDDSISLNNTSPLFAPEYNVIDSIETTGGKYPSALGNIAMIDSKYVRATLRDQFESNGLLQILFQLFGVSDIIDQFLDDFKINEYTLTTILQSRDRMESYLKSPEGLTADMIYFSDRVAQGLGVDYPYDVSFPLVDALEGVQFIRLFLDQIFNAVIAMLVILGVLLIYALLLANVEEKTVEYGMLRALGMQHTSLLVVIVVQAVFFALPGIGVGLLLSFLLNIAVENVIAYYIGNEPSYALNVASTVLPLALGLLIPLISNIIPIRRALSKTLRDSLDIYHHTISQTKVTMIRLSRLGLEPWQTVLALLLVVFGFSVYYLIPLSFIFNEFSLFFTILNIILLGMLLGLCIVAVVLQPFLETLVLNVILIGKERRMKSLISKHLAGHRKRSRKTFLMFTISVAFIIFAGVVFSLQAASVVQNIESFIGADISMQSISFDAPLPIDRIREFFNSETINPAVRDYGFVSYQIRLYPSIRGNSFSTFAQYPSIAPDFVSIPENYLQITFSKYLLTTEVDQDLNYNETRSGAPDIAQSLYTQKGKAQLPVEKDLREQDRNRSIIFSGLKRDVPDNFTEFFDPNDRYENYIDFIMSESARSLFTADINTPYELSVDTSSAPGRYKRADAYLGKARAIVYKLPGFFFSSYSTAARASPVLVSEDEMRRILMESVTPTIPLSSSSSSSSNNTNEENINFNSNDDNNNSNFDNSNNNNDNNNEALDQLLFINQLMNENNENNPYKGKEIPKQKLVTDLYEDTNSTQREDIMNGLRSLVDDDFIILIDVQSTIDSTSTATSLIIAFFNLVAIIACILCFFILWLSFSQNVRENVWEFGVLRAIGLSVRKLIRAYIYEAIILVLSAFFCGTVIGVAVAITLTLQFNLFLELPFQFGFPWSLFSSLFGISLIVAIVGSYIPARTFQKQEIASVLKGL